ncbi:Os08g0190250, partial [Oryza sativa Japonica Group]
MRRQVVHAHRQYLVHRRRHLLPLHLLLRRLFRRCRRRLAGGSRRDIIEAILLRRHLLRRCRRRRRIIEAMDHGIPFILLLGPQESGEHDDVERQVGSLRHGVHDFLELLHLLRVRLAVAVHPPAEQLGGLLRPQLPELPGAHDAAGLLRRRLLADLDLRRDEHAAAGEAGGERGEEEGPLLPAPDVVEHHEVPPPLERGGEARLDEPLRLHPTPAPHVVVGGGGGELIVVVAGGGVGLADDVVEEVGEAELAGDVDPRRAGEVLPDAAPPVEVARQRRLADAALAGEVDH